MAEWPYRPASVLRDQPGTWMGVAVAARPGATVAVPLADRAGVTYHRPMILARHVSVPAITVKAKLFRSFADSSRLSLLQGADQPVAACPTFRAAEP